MSEEKLYAVKNDEGEYWDFKDLDGFWGLYDASRPITVSEENANAAAHNYGAHVVMFVEEPEKVVLSKEQAEIVEGAYASDVPASYISNRTAAYNGEERLLMSAYTNGYTVAKKKRYLLPMEGFGEHQGYSYMEDGIWYINTAPTQDYAVKHGYTVTKDEYDSAPNWVKVLKPVEVTDDGIR